MQQPPNYPNYEGWQQPQQPNTQYPPSPQPYYPPLQQPWQQPPRQEQFPFQQQSWQPPQVSPPPRKKRNPWLIIGIIIGALVLLGSLAIAISKSASPTLSPDQYKAQTQDTTVDNLDKDANTDKGKDVHFTCKILKFVKDDSGNTAGANVESSDTSSFTTSVIQIGFPSGTDVTKLNEGDTLEVWGTDQGVFSGKNAFGGDVQEVAVTALYMTDTTTGYQTS